MGQGIIGWRMHVGYIFPTPIPPHVAENLAGFGRLLATAAEQPPSHSAPTKKGKAR